MKKRVRRMLGGLVYRRLMEAVDLDKLLELESVLLLHACGGEQPQDPFASAEAEVVAELVRRQWRRLGEQVIGRLAAGDILPRPGAP